MDPIKIRHITPIYKNCWNDADTVSPFVMGGFMSFTTPLLYRTYCGTWALCSWPIQKLSYLETSMRCGVMLTKSFGKLWKAGIEFGLVDPADPRQPTFTKDIFKLLEAEIASQKMAAWPSVIPTLQPLISSTPVAPSSKSVMQSGYVYLMASREMQPKKKNENSEHPCSRPRNKEW